MQKIYARDFDIASGICGSADAIEKLLNENREKTEIYFDEGEYFLERYVDVRNLNNVKIIGNNTIFSVKFDPCNPTDAQGAFRFYDCNDIALIGIGLTNDKNVNSAGEVIEKDAENLSYKMKLYDEFTMTGNEKMLAVDSIDEDGSPDYVMVHYRGDTSYENIGDNVLKVTLSSEHRQQIENLKIGHKLAIRHALSGNPTICLYSCRNVLLEDIRIYSTHSYAITIYPRSENVTVRRMEAKIPEGSKRLMTTNKDGIHIAGCMGTFILEDSEFINMGDDILNVHSKAGAVSDIKNGVIKCVDIKYEDGVPYHRSVMQSEPLADWWAKSGDILDIHDSKTFAKKASVKVKSYKNGDLVLEDNAGAASGDILCNSEFYCRTEIKNVNVRNTRARGFLLQTHNVLIEKCSLYGIALSGILFAPDAVVWAEVGPSEDVVIRNNTFEKCCNDYGILSNGVISFQESHDSYKKMGYGHIHKRLTIDNNIFRDCGNKALNFSSAEDVVVRYNEFTNCVDTKLPQKVCVYAENVNELQVAVNTITDNSGLLTENVIGSCTYINANHINREKEIDVPESCDYQELIYKIVPGRALSLTFYPPKKKCCTKAPVLFMIPGGGWWTEKRASMFEFVGESAEELRECGFAVVSIDYRVYSEPNVVMKDIVTDCFDALRYVSYYSDVLEIDKDRISLISHSAGGHLSLMTAYANANDFKDGYLIDSEFTIKSVAALSPLTNLKKSSNTFGFDFSKAFEGCDTDDERLRLSPISYVSEKTPPTFLGAGTSDRLVYPNSSEHLYEKLKKFGVECELVLSLCGGHVFEQMHKGIEPNPSKDEVIKKAKDFILKNI